MTGPANQGPDAGRRPVRRAVDLQLSTLRLEQTGRVLTVLIDAPPFNYLTATMQRDFARVVAAVDRDSSVGAVVVTGAPDGRFITHYDIGDILAAAERFPVLPRPVAAAVLAVARRLSGGIGGRLLDRTPAAGLLAIVRFHQLALAVTRSPAVWIAAVDGPCGGGGLELSVFFDLRVASERAKFLVPELSIGLTTTIGAQRLTHLLGPARTMELMLEADAIGAAQAQAIGLVNRVVGGSGLRAEAARMARRYAARPRAAVAAQKRIVNDAYRRRARQVLAREGTAQVVGVPSATTRAALRRWLQMRQGTDGDSVFLTDPAPWVDGTAVPMNPTDDTATG